MKTGISIAFVAVALFAFGASNAQADKSSTGECNSFLAKANGVAHQLYVGVGDMEAQCMELGVAYGEFFTAGCFGPLESGDLKGIAGRGVSHPAGPKADSQKPLGEVICNAIFMCGGCPLVPGFPEEPVVCFDLCVQPPL